MEIREILDTIDSDPNMDEQLQKEILEKIENIANADKIVDGLEEKIEQHKSELSEKELKYIINKCIAYKSVFYKFRNGKIVEYDQINEITNRIFDLEESIKKNDFSVWKQELLAYKGSKEDKEEDKMLKNMLMVVPEDKNVVDKVTRMFRRAMWKFQQKVKEKHKDEEQEVIELPQTTNPNIDINIDDDFEEVKAEEILNKDIPEEKVEEVEQDSIEKSQEELKEENTEPIAESNIEEIKEEIVEEPKKRVRKGSNSNNAKKGNQQSTNIEEEQEKEDE